MNTADPDRTNRLGGADNEAGEENVPPEALHRYIVCEACGKRMLVTVEMGTHEHRCPICGVAFVTTRQDRSVSVRFGRAP